MSSAGRVRLLYPDDRHVLLDNGILQLTLSNPDGIVTGVRYHGVDNLLEVLNQESNRGYWDVVWNEPGGKGIFDVLKGTDFRVILEDESQVEVSFTRTWDSSLQGKVIPINIDKRFVVLRGSSGFYTYAIYEHMEGWPDFNLGETRVAFKLRKDKFQYMAMADDRQRVMPFPDDRMPERSQRLAYAEAVLLTNPINPELKGEVDDKYQYSCDNKDNKVHGWVSLNPPVGFWQITPSDEFRSGGPVKQNLTSHVGPTTLAMFHSAHYAGDDLVPKFRNGEYWKKVFGPVFIYLNSTLEKADPLVLWEDAKIQMHREVESWPYSFPLSEDFPKADQRGSISGRLLMQTYQQIQLMLDWLSQETLDHGKKNARLLRITVHTILCLKQGYQFWARADVDGFFSISNVRTGDYNLYAWVPGFIGDYKYDANITITPGSDINLGDILYEPPRDGPTVWEIGIPDRSAAEFYIPDPNPLYINKLYVNHPDKFRQYGLWERFAELYPDGDLVYTVGVSDYGKDWFFAQVPRRKPDSSYQGTTWQIKFKLDSVVQGAPYKLRVAIASSTLAELQVRFNDPRASPAHFTTGLFGRDNSVARHGIHGLHWLFTITVRSSWLSAGENTAFLTQPRSSGPFPGIMYDYIRFEGPAPSSPTPHKPSPSK
ncbi:hypothetical protein Taro_006227 [Colocasia esculenta]|uniref:rhamnogalacturonan endolyase n=1 Tax=Colocasia esculenta TaxID=4460 RepID=A0A843TN20_COLES|nr:hypothetical protein [Colocasia esculenta]